MIASLGIRNGYEYAIQLQTDEIIRRDANWTGNPGCGWRFQSTWNGWKDIGHRVHGFTTPLGESDPEIVAR